MRAKLAGLSTNEILVHRALNRIVDGQWIEWAASMLEKGLDSYHLRILAGETPPYFQSELISLADKTFEELGLNWSDTERAVRRYAAELLADLLAGTREAASVLKSLKDLCLEMKRPPYLYDFYMLHYALLDLQEEENTPYWSGAHPSNIFRIITDTARIWLEGFERDRK